ncbi:PIG-L family deacetylase [Ilumatobacter coccineus]|uniref:Putative hydrolase n=1 Tax=Ilumatobacter coccineus (strain NBRC 103263 / KCTC 29153 / YM16-304) TaxID=1313172 RepID=A0A6C7E8H1_ILUCY|nr:PIG-L family deacetylase [Ilumatobacter coccineus]BAN02653.1 putative hydrolase [Ilumatobacter coccineus YM16-304]
MSTLVCLHAHPDDEAISTGGTMARAAAEGHRVVLVVATNGDFGEVPDDLAEGETLADRRRVETERSADALGIHRVAWLGYSDSGMTGWEQNANADSFHQADLDEAAGRLADILREEDADVLTCYDWHGTYGHPDHIKVHTVGRRAAEMVPGLRVLEATANRDAMVAMITAARESGEAPEGDGAGLDFDPAGPADDGNPFGEPESALTLCVDVVDYIDQKRAALGAHRSQITDSSFFMEMPPEVFAMSFGKEWFIEHDAQPPYRVGWIFDTPDA